MELSVEVGEVWGEGEERAGGRGREPPKQFRQHHPLFLGWFGEGEEETRWRTKLGPLTGVSGVSRRGGKGWGCSHHPLGGLFVASVSTFRLLCGKHRWERRRVGPELPLSLSQRKEFRASGTSTGPAIGLPTQSTTRTTLPPTPFLLSAQAPAFTRLLPDDACTSLGRRDEKSPRWQPFKPPSLQHRSHPSGSLISTKLERWHVEKKKKKKKKKKTLLRRDCWGSFWGFFVFKPTLDDQTKRRPFKVRVCSSLQASPSSS